MVYWKIKKLKQLFLKSSVTIIIILFFQQSAISSVFAGNDWEISPYPDGHNFAFTIVHDADSAYSKRLKPLFDEFDELGLKITVTVFAFWAKRSDAERIRSEWNQTKNDQGSLFVLKSVPLEDEKEREFYKQLEAKGYEIGLHTPSETSDRREEIIRAYDYFKEIFGYYPKIYVEHSRKNNLEDQCSEGANPESIYYNTDLLNSYQSWIWTDGPGALPEDKEKCYDLIAANGSPFNDFALKTYGIVRGFVRTGAWKNSDGDGFLITYSLKNTDSLEKNHGVALVYTHLDNKWLDTKTRKMFKPIKDRLRYIASKNGWFVPAGQILDRFEAIKKIQISYNDKWIKITNMGQYDIDGLTIISNTGGSLSKGDVIFAPNKDKKIIVGNIKPYEILTFKIQ